jgi:AraC family ethanolamine operon transcriptional activator
MRPDRALFDSDFLPTRTLDLTTEDPEEFGCIQPERRRRFDQLERGRFEGHLVEVSWGAAALQRERWGRGVRARSDRPSGYVAFAVTEAAGDVRWCGVALAPGDLLQVDGPWELTSSGWFELTAFAVDGARLLEMEDQLSGGAERADRFGNSRVRTPQAARLATQIRRLLATLRSAPAGAAELAAAESDLLHLAASLRRAFDLRRQGIAWVTPSKRRLAVRRIEEYLDAHGEAVPSIATLCAIAEVSERTLEYAFREHLATTPVKFLRLRRLNRVRREILDPETGADGIAAAARRAGIYDLGRFSGDYRRLFGELPSETLRRSRRRLGRSVAEGSQAREQVFEHA